MKHTTFLMACIFLLATLASSQTLIANNTDEKYVCLPCGRDCDKQVYTQMGDCSHCRMELVEQATVVHKTIDPKLICDSLSGMKEVILLDVRSREEFEGIAEENFGRLKNSINIPIQQLESRLKELEAHRNKRIIVYCSHSHRSPQASYILTRNGFTNVSNMSGGMSVLFDEKNNSCITN